LDRGWVNIWKESAVANFTLFGAAHSIWREILSGSPFSWL